MRIDMAYENSTQPTTVALGEKRKATDIKVHGLLIAVKAFLAEKGITVGWTTFFGERATRDYPAVTTFRLGQLVENGVLADPERYIEFELVGKCANSPNSRLGSGPFALEIIRTRTLAEAEQNMSVTTFDVVMCPNEDRTVSFFPVKRREGDAILY